MKEKSSLVLYCRTFVLEMPWIILHSIMHEISSGRNNSCLWGAWGEGAEEREGGGGEGGILYMRKNGLLKQYNQRVYNVRQHMFSHRKFRDIHWENYTFNFFHIEWDMIVVTVFLLILNQMEFYLVATSRKALFQFSFPVYRDFAICHQFFYRAICYSFQCGDGCTTITLINNIDISLHWWYILFL